MLTLRAAAALLAQTNSLATLRLLANSIGFHTADAVDRDAQHHLGVDHLVSAAEVIRGPGRMRCISAILVPHAHRASTIDPRELTRRLCLALAHRAPTRDWCAVTLDVSLERLTIATVAPHHNGPRITALHIDRRHVVDSDADTLRALVCTTEADGALRHARFIDILGRDALSQRFYRALDRAVQLLADSATGTASPQVRRELALLCASRCLFLSFLEAKGWLDHQRQFLLHHATSQLELGGKLHDKLLRPLFFGSLNTPRAQRAAAARAFGDVPFLNGGLFSPTPLEKQHRTIRFTDDAIAALIGELLDRYRFTAREDSATWSEAAIDPEMLGRAFESLMSADERHRSGTFYTPPRLVETTVQSALRALCPELSADVFADAISNHLDSLNHDAPRTLSLAPRTRLTLTNARVLDPACGSGAFLVYTLECLASIAQKSGDTRPLHLIRRDVLTRQIFGVDRNPMAVWLCELRLWLSIVIECPETHIDAVPPLPNLDHHIRLGDSLAGGHLRFAPPSARRLTALRDRYSRATGTRKHTLASALDREERLRAIAETRRMHSAMQRERADTLATLRDRDLFGTRRARSRADTVRLLNLRTQSRELATRQRRLESGGALPFRFAAQFADVAAAGGFSLVVGNPPWVRPHALPHAERLQLRAEFRTMRHAAWKVGALRAGAGNGFSAQADLAVAFVERSVQLLAPDGVLGLLLPAKLWRALAGGGLREFLHDHTTLRALHDWSDAPALFDAAVYPSLLVAQRTVAADVAHTRAQSTGNTQPSSSPLNPPMHVAVSRKHHIATFSAPSRTLTLDNDPAAPWLLMPDTARRAFHRLRAAGPALGDSPLGRPQLGVKCGCNAAFIVNAHEQDDDVAQIESEHHRGMIERRLLRPVMKGDAVGNESSRDRRNGNAASAADLRIVWTHGPDGKPVSRLPPLATRWLSHWRSQLDRRKDGNASTPWWSLFRTASAQHESPRVVWADIGKQLRAAVLPAGDPTVALNTCYVMRTSSIEDAHALHTLLTSPVAAAWFDALAEPARGGFRRFLGWTVATLPTPENWTTTRCALADFYRARLRDTRTPAHHLEHSAVVADAYGVPLRHLEPLLHWYAP